MQFSKQTRTRVIVTGTAAAAESIWQRKTRRKRRVRERDRGRGASGWPSTLIQSEGSKLKLQQSRSHGTGRATSHLVKPGRRPGNFQQRCHINHFPISLIPRDCRHLAFRLAIWVAMETGGRGNPKISVVNQTQLNKWRRWRRRRHVAGKQESSLLAGETKARRTAQLLPLTAWTQMAKRINLGSHFDSISPQSWKNDCLHSSKI